MMLSDADLAALVRMLQAKAPLGEIINMQARVGGRRFQSLTMCSCGRPALRPAFAPSCAPRSAARCAAMLAAPNCSQNSSQ
jgi:hypothetical protein